jgi:hypothetical protein
MRLHGTVFILEHRNKCSILRRCDVSCTENAKRHGEIQPVWKYESSKEEGINKKNALHAANW